MREATRLEGLYGAESRTVPAYEMLGDLLLQLNQPKRALAVYTAALKERSTNHLNSFRPKSVNKKQAARQDQMEMAEFLPQAAPVLDAC